MTGPNPSVAWEDLAANHELPWARCDGCGLEVEFPTAPKCQDGVEAAMAAAGWRVGPMFEPGDRCPSCVGGATPG